MRRLLLIAAIAGAGLTPAAAWPAGKCELGEYQPDRSKAAGFKIHEMGDAEKARAIAYLKRTQGEPPANADSFMQYPAFAVYENTAHFSSGPYVPDRGAIVFTDRERHCIILKIGGGALLVRRILSGTWRVQAY